MCGFIGLNHIVFFFWSVSCAAITIMGLPVHLLFNCGLAVSSIVVLVLFTGLSFLADLPPTPNNVTVTIHETIHINWTQPSDSAQCTVSYIVSTTATTNNSPLTTTDTSIDLPLAGLSPGNYTVSVAAVDTGNGTGNSEEVKFELRGLKIMKFRLCLRYFLLL